MKALIWSIAAIAVLATTSVIAKTQEKVAIDADVVVDYRDLPCTEESEPKRLSETTSEGHVIEAHQEVSASNESR